MNVVKIIQIMMLSGNYLELKFFVLLIFYQILQTNLGGEDVFLKSSVLLYTQQLNASDPAGLFRAMLDLLIPDNISSNQALSRTGKGDTAALPEKIVLAVNSKLHLIISLAFF